MLHPLVQNLLKIDKELIGQNLMTDIAGIWTLISFIRIFLIFMDNYEKLFLVKIIKRTKAQVRSPPWMTNQLTK